MTTWPGGHVTMLLAALGAGQGLSVRWPEALTRAVTGAFAEYGGVEPPQAEESALLGLFPGSRPALLCARSLQAASARSRKGMDLRIGVHTAEEPAPSFAKGDYAGQDLDKVRRVARLGEPGQVLVTGSAHRSCLEVAEFRWQAWPGRCLGPTNRLETLWELLGDGASRGCPGGLGSEILRRADRAAAKGDWLEARQLGQEAWEALQRAGDRVGQGRAQGTLGAACLGLGQLEPAGRHLEAALELVRQTGDRQTESVVLTNKGVLCQRQGALGESESFHRRSLILRQELGDGPGGSLCLRALGALYRQSGRLDQAEEALRAALEAAEEAQDARGLALGWLARGRLDQCRGQALVAEGHLRRALEFFVSAGDRRGEAHLLSNLGVVNQELGLHARSERMHRSAMNLLQESGDEADLWRARVNFGALLAARGDATAARRQLEECLEFGSTQGYPDVAGASLANLALLRDQAGDWATALTLARRALQPLQEAGLEALANQVQGWLEEWAPAASSGSAAQSLEGLPPL